jgi:Ca2+-binding RTX toxin-like protein
LSGWPDLICGFGGNDTITFASSGNYDTDRTVREGDVFLGGEGNDSLYQYTRNGVFYGGPGEDYVSEVHGPFYGGSGNDSVRVVWGGTFYGEDGDDYAQSISSGGTFHGGPGNDAYGNSLGVFVQD